MKRLFTILFLVPLLAWGQLNQSGILGIVYQPAGITISQADYNYLRSLSASNVSGCTVFSSDGQGVKLWLPDGGAYYNWTYSRDLSLTVRGRRDLFTASDLQAWLDWVGAKIPATGTYAWQVPDHVRTDGVAYFDASGGSRSPLDNQCWYINLVYEHYLKAGPSWYNTHKTLLSNLINLAMPYSGGAVYVADVDYGQQGYQGWGFTDSEFFSGYLTFMNALTYQALTQLAEMAEANGDAADAATYTAQANTLKTKANAELWDSAANLYKASTIKGAGQYDIWANAFAVWTGLATDAMALQIAQKLKDTKQYWYYQGGIRQVATNNEHTNGVRIWEAYLTGAGLVTTDPTQSSVGGTNAYNQYQNGGYWFTPINWVLYTIGKVDKPLASTMLAEAVDKMQTQSTNAPYEWHNQVMQNVSRYVSSACQPLGLDLVVQ
jgi:hypothetical protein